MSGVLLNSEDQLTSGGGLGWEKNGRCEAEKGPRVQKHGSPGLVIEEQVYACWV